MLVDDLPGHVPLVLAARVDPALSPRRRSVRGEVAEIGLVGTVLDVTWQKEAEQRLAVETQRLEDTLEAAHAAGWLLDRRARHLVGHDHVLG